MTKKKYKNRIYIGFASLLIAGAVILLTVLPREIPSTGNPPAQSSKHGARPRSAPSAARKVPQGAPSDSSSTTPQGAHPRTTQDAQTAQGAARDTEASPQAPQGSPGGPGGGSGSASGVAKTGRKRGSPARIAVIIDDVGYDSEHVDKYLTLQAKLTFSVLPFLENSEAYARALYDAGFEVLIHVPMEPARYPSVDPGPGALLRGEPRQAVERKVHAMIEENPYAAGANNHMGSRATQDRELMGWTMSALKERNLFFVDSLTSPKSCAFELAREEGLSAARRDVFLDNVDSAESIRAQFSRLKRVARSNGTAIGIGHIHKRHTFEVLAREIPLLEGENLTLVFASETVHDRP